MTCRATSQKTISQSSLRSTGIEALESRQMLHAAIDLTVSFQPKHNPVPANTVPDVGDVYGDRGNGMTFGWNANNSRNMRDRNSKRVQRYDTLAQLQAGGNFSWEMALPDGQYRVSIWSGDVRYPEGGMQVIRAEGVSAIKGATSAKKPILSSTKIVTVTDGRLTIKTAKGARNAKLNAIRVQSYHIDGNVEPPTAIVTAATTDASAAEGDADHGTIRLTRAGGDLTKPLTVKLAWSGSAGSDDVSSRPTTATFNASQAVIDLDVKALTDTLVEADETAKLTISAGSGYVIGGSGSASVIVHDTPIPAARNNVSWAAAATAPVGRVEPESMVVDGKLYAFSGYSDSSWQPTRRVDRYDPATNQWTRMGDMPIGITHAAVTLVGSKVWFAGGYAERVGVYGQQDIAITTVKIYDTVTDTWSDGPSLPAQRASGGLGLVDNKLYFFSGERRDRTNMTDTWMLDLANQSAGWQARAAIPEGRTHFGTVVIDGTIYAMGGQQAIDENATFLKTSYVYNPSTNQWRRLADLPIAMSHYSPCTVTFENKIYMFGGEYAFNYESTQALEYNPSTDSFRTLAPLPVARAAAMAGVIDGKFVFSCGKNGGWQTETYIGTWI